MKRALLGILAVACVVLATSNFAKADSFDLTYQNGNVPGTSPYGTVSVTGTCTAGVCTQVVITFTVNAGLDMFGNDAAAWNETTTAGITSITVAGTAVVGSPGTPTLDQGFDNKVNMDGFGSGANGFDAGAVGGTGSSSGYSQIVVTINGTGLTLGQFEGTNGAGVQFSAQVGGYNDNPQGLPTCTGYVGTQGTLTAPSPTGTCGTTTVPEPGTLTLLGTGLLGLAGLVRRKLSA